MAIRAAPHVHGPGRAFVIHCASEYLFVVVVHCTSLAHALGHAVCVTCCMCLMMLLGLSARAAVTGHSLCLARGQHTFDVFIVLKTGPPISGKIFF